MLEPSLVREADVTDGLEPDGLVLVNAEERAAGARRRRRALRAGDAARRERGSGFVNLSCSARVAAALGEPPLEGACRTRPSSCSAEGRRRRASRAAVAEGYAMAELRRLAASCRRRASSSPDEAPRPRDGRLAHRLKPEVELSTLRQLPALLALLPGLGGPLDGTTFAGFDLDSARAARSAPRSARSDAIAMVAEERRLSARAQLLTGGEAVAHAMRQIDPDVVPVYPITPQTPIIQGFAKFVADGRAHGELVDVESEHSAMSAAIGSALAGARTMTATSSQGLALMAEVVYIAAAMRAPIVMALGNRALSGPINIHCDHSDSMLIRDSGVVQLFAENAQEAYDLTVLGAAARRAPRRAAAGARLPGRLHDHARRRAGELLADDGRARLRRRVPRSRIRCSTSRSPTTQGPFAMPDYYFELRRQQVGRARGGARRAVDELARRVRAAHGRQLRRVEDYRLDGAERVLVALGSTAGTVKDVVDELRDEGERGRAAADRARSGRFPAASVARGACGRARR